MHSHTAPQSFSDLKTELVAQGQKYAAEAISYRHRIAELMLGFIKDDSVVLHSSLCCTSVHPLTAEIRSSHIPILVS